MRRFPSAVLDEEHDSTDPHLVSVYVRENPKADELASSPAESKALLVTLAPLPKADIRERRLRSARTGFYFARRLLLRRGSPRCDPALGPSLVTGRTVGGKRELPLSGYQISSSVMSSGNTRFLNSYLIPFL